VTIGTPEQNQTFLEAMKMMRDSQPRPRLVGSD
jgi:hypothetical protein